MSVTLTAQLLDKLAVTTDALEKSSGTDWVRPEIEFSNQQQIDLAAKRLDSDRGMRAVLAEQGWSASEYLSAFRELLRTLLLLHTKVGGSAVEMQNTRVLSELTLPEAPRFFAWAKEHLAPELRGLLRIE